MEEWHKIQMHLKQVTVDTNINQRGIHMRAFHLSKMFLGTLSVLAFTSLNLAHAHSVGNAKAAELAFHRLERLVTLKKIEEPFQSQLRSLKLENIPHQEEEQPSYKATIYQYPGADGTQKALEVILDEEGKTLKYSVLPGSTAVGAPQWPDKDITTLCEYALHYVLENGSSKAELMPFHHSLSSISVNEGTNSAGKKVALIEIQATEKEPILKISMNLDGSVDSVQFVPKTQ